MAFPVTGTSPSMCSTVPTTDGCSVKNRNQGQNAGFVRDPKVHYIDRHPDTTSK